MRTTLTLDEDVILRVQRLQAARGIAFKEAVNLLLRAGLDHEHLLVPPLQRYTTPPVSTGLPAVDLTRASDLATLEDEAAWARR